MRIALVASSYAPYVGGVEEHVRNVAHLLQARGHEVAVWTINREGGHVERTLDGIQVRELPAPLPARSLRAMLSLALRLPSAVLRWRRAYRALRPDVIHVQCFGPNGTYARVLAARTHTPLMISTHGETLADDAGVFSTSAFAVDSLRKGLSIAAAVTGCSQVAVNDLVSRFDLLPDRGVVVFNGIDPNEPMDDSPAEVDGRYIVAVGRLQPVKGFDLLIDAFAKADLPDDVRLIIGGGGPQLSALRTRAQRLGVGDRVQLLGWLEHPKILRLQKDALLGVVPSRFEAFGIAVLELWRAHTPLVATTHGGPPEFVQNGTDALLVPPEDIDGLARALEELTHDRTRAELLADAGIKRLPEFTWDRVVDAYEAKYRDITRSRI